MRPSQAFVGESRFTMEKSDFILNCDVKYCLGRDAEAEE